MQEKKLQKKRIETTISSCPHPDEVGFLPSTRMDFIKKAKSYDLAFFLFGAHNFINFCALVSYQHLKFVCRCNRIIRGVVHR